MSLAFVLGAAAVAAACAWPASAVVRRHFRTGLGSSPLLIAPPMAILAAVAAGFVHPPLVACAACWLAIWAVPLAVIDARAQRLPDSLTGIAFIGVSAFLLAAAAAGDRWPELTRAGGGALAVSGLFLLLALIKPGSAGLGDAKLGLSIGALAAWLGWAVLAAAIFAGFLLAGGYGIWLLASRRASLHSSVPYGPFLLAGCLAVVFLARL